MEQQALEARILELVCDNTRPGHLIGSDSPLHLLHDSVDIIAVLLRCEDEFELLIPDSDLRNVRTVGELARYVGARLEQDRL